MITLILFPDHQQRECPAAARAVEDLSLLRHSGKERNLAHEPVIGRAVEVEWVAHVRNHLTPVVCRLDLQSVAPAGQTWQAQLPLPLHRQVDRLSDRLPLCIDPSGCELVSRQIPQSQPLVGLALCAQRQVEAIQYLLAVHQQVSRQGKVGCVLLHRQRLVRHIPYRISGRECDRVIPVVAARCGLRQRLRLQHKVSVRATPTRHPLAVHIVLQRQSCRHGVTIQVLCPTIDPHRATGDIAGRNAVDGERQVHQLILLDL